jgi:endonuclease/exonuclease/phosphatase family metal-dependent hydrolase
MVALVALTPLLLIPLIGVLISAWRSWDRKLALAFVGLAAGYAATFVSPSAVIGCGPSSSDDEIVIYTHNVWWRRGEPEAIANSIDSSQADIVVLQEVSPELIDALGQHPLLADDYRFRASEPSDEDINGLAVWSRYPISDATVDVLGETTPRLRTTIESPRGPFRLDAVHVTAPISDDRVREWETQLSQLAATDDAAPTLLAGDFNATEDHLQFRSILEQGWTDAHGPKGCGLDATWASERWFPTLLRLDHVLASGHFEVLALEVGHNASSDHRPVIATVRIR